MNSDLKFSIKSKLFIAVCLTAAICVSLPLGFAYHLLKADLMVDSQNSVRERWSLPDASIERVTVPECRAG